MATAKQVNAFVQALYEHVQLPGWFMMKRSNPRYGEAKAIEDYFAECGDDVRDLCRKYLKSPGVVQTDFDLHIAAIVSSQQWQTMVSEYIKKLGQFGDGAEVLLGPKPERQTA